MVETGALEWVGLGAKGKGRCFAAVEFQKLSDQLWAKKVDAAFSVDPAAHFALDRILFCVSFILRNAV